MTVAIVKDEAETKLRIRDYRCKCGRLQFRIRYPLVPGLYVEVRCPKCGYMNVLTTYEGEQHNDPIS